MLEIYVRPLYQRLLVAPAAKKLTHKITPNQITLIGCISGILVFPALLFNLSSLALLFLLLSGYCDTLDGTIARLTHTTSNAGTVLDIMSDRIVEFSVILGLFSVQPETRAWAVLLMLGSVLLCVTSFLVVGLFTPNTSEKSFYYSPGLIERAEAFVFFILMILIPDYFQILAFLFTVLVLLTAVIRLLQFLRFKALD